MLSSRIMFLIFIAVIGAFSAAAEADCPNTITRSSWGAKEANQVALLATPVSHVIIHHTVTAACFTVDNCSKIVRNIQKYHMENMGWADIAYSFLVGGDGNVYEARGWNKIGAHTFGWNNKSVAIAFIGTYQDIEPSETMLGAARQLIACGKNESMLRSDVKVIGARQVGNSISPGDKLYAQIKTWPEWSPSP